MSMFNRSERISSSNQAGLTLLAAMQNVQQLNSEKYHLSYADNTFDNAIARLADRHDLSPENIHSFDPNLTDLAGSLVISRALIIREYEKTEEKLNVARDAYFDILEEYEGREVHVATKANYIGIIAVKDNVDVGQLDYARGKLLNRLPDPTGRYLSLGKPHRLGSPSPGSTPVAYQVDPFSHKGEHKVHLRIF